MKVYIQSDKNNIPKNVNVMNAYQGFFEMGFEIVHYQTTAQLWDSNREDVIVGGIGAVKSRLYDFGITAPDIDYPQELNKYLGRKVWYTKMSEVNDHPENWPVFVKPVEEKQFTGVAVYSTKDLIGCGIAGVDQDVICSEVVDFVAERRCFVRYGKILDVRNYYGDWRKELDYRVIENAVADYASAPNGYAMDFGLTADGRTLLVEVNDGYSLGCYGLMHYDYAKLLSARWAELTGTKDECSFDR